ncbi:MAG: hypothetical protein H6883_08725 [Rhodobiaceae bacterium]|nr:hypothetical protein [Rhodobiaceae bacterium]MCC0056208.1 hypothetical protein [Rhodobiaceae bacterium]
MQVMTVLGSVDVSTLGRTLIHEHLFAKWPGAEFFPPMKITREWLLQQCYVRLGALKDQGVRTFVDPCPIELGRDVTLMAEVSRKVGMNIICTTGFYHEGPGLPYFWRPMTARQIADFYIGEIVNGVDGTDIRPGAIKCATSAEPTETEAKFLEAASIAHHETGVPLITHTTGGLGGPEQQAIFASHGVKPHRCLIGHCSDNPDPAYHQRVAEGGTYIGFDRLGFEYPSPETSADNVVRLVRNGYRPQVMLSTDRLCVFQGQMSRKPPTDDPYELKALMEQGKWPPPQTFLIDEFFPLLRERGLSDSEIFAMIEENPTRYFAGEPF